jgi:hypothetical protein
MISTLSSSTRRARAFGEFQRRAVHVHTAPVDVDQRVPSFPVRSHGAGPRLQMDVVKPIVAPNDGRRLLATTTAELRDEHLFSPAGAGTAGMIKTAGTSPQSRSGAA